MIVGICVIVTLCFKKKHYFLGMTLIWILQSKFNVLFFSSEHYIILSELCL